MKRITQPRVLASTPSKGDSHGMPGLPDNLGHRRADNPLDHRDGDCAVHRAPQPSPDADPPARRPARATRSTRLPGASLERPLPSAATSLDPKPEEATDPIIRSPFQQGLNRDEPSRPSYHQQRFTGNTTFFRKQHDYDKKKSAPKIPTTYIPSLHIIDAARLDALRKIPPLRISPSSPRKTKGSLRSLRSLACRPAL